MRLSVRWKLTVPFIFIILLALGVLLPVANALLGSSIEAEADRRLNQSADSVTVLLKNLEEKSLLSANFVANLSEVESFEVTDRSGIEQVLVPRRDSLALQELSYYTADFQPGAQPLFYGGPLVARRLQVSENTTRIRETLIVRAIQSGRADSGIAIAPQSSQVIGVAPVRRSGSTEIIGVIMAVFYLDEEYVADISEVLGASVGIVKDNDIIVSTIDSSSGYEKLIRDNFVDPDGKITAQNLSYSDNRHERLLAHPLVLDGKTQGTLLVAQSTHDLLLMQQNIQLLLFVFAGIVAVTSLVFGIAAIHNFALPLAAMAKASFEVSHGNFERRVDIASMYKVRDEITDLGENFNAMTERLGSLYNNLELQVQARTKELVEERNRLDVALRDLAVARDQALEANRAKSAFLANMSHELRTPLNAIIGYSEMLQEEAQDLGETTQELVPDLEKIHGAGRHLLSLINDILDLSKIEAGKMDLYLEYFDTGPMLQEVLNTIRPLIEKKSNQLVITRQPEELGSMHADLTKMRQILFNLLSNAAKFTEQGTITLAVKREALVGADGQSVDWMTFSVTDTGIGMTPEQLNQLFQAFVQADASTTRKYGGTGLGLTITKRFCEMMGGEIRVESEVGHGSTFIAHLPVNVPEQRVEPETVVRPAHATLTTINRVLVIDDDNTVRDLVERYLSKEGFKVTTASNGNDGLRLAKELRPDAITLDVMMPGMDGWAVLSALKADPDLADIPVIMLTIAENQNLGYALGAADYLIKPVDHDRLITVLRRHACEEMPCSILVVEDDPTAREMMQRLLEREGWLVCEASDGRAALEVVGEVKPQLILLDLMMPEMDGFQFVAELRKHEEWRTIPVVVVTAKDLTQEDRMRLSGYVEAVLQKGAYGKEDLLNEVRDLIDTHALARRAAIVE
jgi:signal transduction histidine kinase/CheY-like chemotaxis protein